MTTDRVIKPYENQMNRLSLAIRLAGGGLVSLVYFCRRMLPRAA
jgi:hypothetical protein